MNEVLKNAFDEAIKLRLSEVFESDFDEWLKYGIVLNGRPLIRRFVKYDNGGDGFENIGLSVEGLQKVREAQKAYVEKCGLSLFEELKICYQRLKVKTKAIDFISFVLDGVGSNDKGCFDEFLKWVVEPQRFFLIMKNYFDSTDFTAPTVENVRDIYKRDVSNKEPISSWVQPSILNEANRVRANVLGGIKDVHTAETVLYGILKFDDYLLSKEKTSEADITRPKQRVNVNAQSKRLRLIARYLILINKNNEKTCFDILVDEFELEWNVGDSVFDKENRRKQIARIIREAKIDGTIKNK